MYRGYKVVTCEGPSRDCATDVSGVQDMQHDVFAAELAFSVGTPPIRSCCPLRMLLSSNIIAGGQELGTCLLRGSAARLVQRRARTIVSRISHPRYFGRALRWSALGAGHEAPDDLTGTTSLLALVRSSDVETVHSWMSGWLQVRVFAADTLPVPVSVDSSLSSDRAILLFYGSDGNVRGSLEFSAVSREPECNAVTLRITSRSRFVNPAGLTSVSLPGERGIVRSLFSAMQTKFGASNCQVLYKPAYIRLGARARMNLSGWRRTFSRTDERGSTDSFCAELSPAVPLSPRKSFGVVFVAEIQGVTLSSVLSMVEGWGPAALFSSTLRTTAVPLSFHPLLGEGVRLLLDKPKDMEIVVRARPLRSGREAFVRNVTCEETFHDESSAVLVSVSTNAPDEYPVQRVLEQLAKELRSYYSQSRIHYPR